MTKTPAPRPGGPATRRAAGKVTDVDTPVPVGFDVTPDEPGAGRGPAVQVRQGGCLCGAVRYVLQGPPKVVGLCHCGDCRKATGGFAMPYADWSNGAVTLMGELATYDGRSFCPRCGSHVAHLNPHHTQISLGTLDDAPFDLSPTREVWTIRRQPWMPPVPGARQFERDAE